MRLATALVTLALSTTVADARPVTFQATPPTSGVLVLPLASEADLERRAAGLDPALVQAVRRGLAAGKFDYKPRSTLNFRALGGYDEIIVVGAGARPSVPDLRELGGVALKAGAKSDGPIAVLAQGLGDPTEIATGGALGAYRFAGYKSETKPAPTAPFVIVAPEAAQAGSSYARRGQALGEAVAFTRDLVTEPANILYPEVFAERTRAAFKGVPNTTVEVLDVPAMQKLGMGAILSVGAGSARPPRMVIVEYRGAGAQGRPLVFTGKGITFDSGGLSLKPGAGMWKMKDDMAGAGAAVGAVLALAKSGAPVHVVAIAALAENMPDGAATRPGDVVRVMNGKTIERLNTDAEGRIVLADATAYADRRFRPAAIVNLATLTGAVGTALGNEYAGLFSRHEGLAAQVQAAAEASGEAVWRLPLHPSYAKDVESPIADIRDISEAASAGAGIGAHVIGFFAEPTTPWAHVDIASVAWFDEEKPTIPKGASGFGVLLLEQLARNFDAGRAAQAD